MNSPSSSSESGKCPICGGGLSGPPVALPGLEISRCRACGHRVARHDTGGDRASDYHEQYDGAFLEALRTTRLRQATRLIAILRTHLASPGGLVDYGAGRGWFLEACRSAGIAPVAGVDTSRVSVESLKASGIEARLLDAAEGAEEAFSRLSFRPRVLSLLDVVEHFPPETLKNALRRIVSACGSGLELVVVKVPVPGLLYAGAAVMSRMGAPGPFQQLYQRGSWPPHFNYFSSTSAERLVTAVGLTVIDRIGDPDFDAKTLGARMGLATPVARGAAWLGGAALAAAIHLTRAFDSLVLVARPGGSCADQ